MINVGNHFGCMGLDGRRFLTEFLPKLVEHGSVRSFGYIWQDSLMRRAVYSQVYPGTDLSALAIHVVNDEKKEIRFTSGYPAALKGSVNSLTIVEVAPSEFGVEAVIRVEAEGGAEFGLFDTAYFANKDQYRVGEACLFEIAALAYSMQFSEIPPATITDPEAVRRLAEIHGEEVEYDENGAVVPYTIDYSDLTMLNSIGTDTPAECEYRFRIAQVDQFTVEEILIYRIKGVLFDSEPPLEGLVYACEDALDGYIPMVGEMVSGECWVQGFLSPSAQS